MRFFSFVAPIDIDTRMRYSRVYILKKQYLGSAHSSGQSYDGLGDSECSYYDEVSEKLGIIYFLEGIQKKNKKKTTIEFPQTTIEFPFTW